MHDPDITSLAKTQITEAQNIEICTNITGGSSSMCKQKNIHTYPWKIQ